MNQYISPDNLELMENNYFRPRECLTVCLASHHHESLVQVPMPRGGEGGGGGMFNGPENVQIRNHTLRFPFMLNVTISTVIL